MKNILYYILFVLLWITTRIPLSFLLIFRWPIFCISYYIFPYRKKIVLKNIRLSFPEKSDIEVKQIAKKFYLYFSQSIIESLYAGFLSSKQAEKRFVIKNPEICNEWYQKGKSISMLMSHYGNWEWSTYMQLKISHQILAIYKPLNNKTIDKIVKNGREKHGVKAIPMEKILRKIITCEKEKIPTMTFFLADQRPLMAKIQYWTKFLNQDTPVVMGPEKIAHRFNHVVVFLKISVLKPGYYEAEFIPISENVDELKEYEIIERYHKLLENMISEHPEYWLWSHNRWKHKIEDYKKLQKKREHQ